jgi:O-antigen ligase
MTQAALALTLAFIFYALRREYRESPSYSWASWISFFWVAISASRPVVYWVYPSQAIAFNQRFGWEERSLDLVQSNPLDRNVMIGMIVIGLIILYRRRDRFGLELGANSWLIAFYVLCLLSLFWAGSPGIVFKRWIRLAGDLIAVLLIMTDRDPEEAFLQTMRRVAIVLFPLCILYIRYYDALGRSYRRGNQMWVGVTGHKNQLGMLCAYLGLILVWRCLKKWPKPDLIDLLLLLMAGYLLAGSGSLTSTVLVLFGVGLLIIQFRTRIEPRKLSRVIVYGLIALFLMQALAVVFLNQSLTESFLSFAGRDSTFTGRVPLWRELIKMIGLNPVLGFGYTSFWISDQVVELWRRVDWTPTTAHNGYLDTLMDLGIVGLAVLLLLLIRSYKNIMGVFGEDRAWGALKAVLFFMVVLHNFTETSLGKANSLLWLLFLSAILVVKTPRRGEAGQDAAPAA